MGAFDYGSYQKGMDGRDDARLGAAIIAIKNELRFNNSARPAMVGDLPFFGDAVSNSVKDFQEKVGLTPDGVCGSRTLKELFRKRIEAAEDANGLLRGVLGKKTSLESGFDPVAVGFVDNDDKGICQINTRIHTSVTEGKAFDPAFAIPWAAAFIASNKNKIEHDLNTLKAARAAYNIGGVYARQWLLAGFPASGGPMLGNVDSFERATKYIELIDKQTW
jgi:peptidoglycan hydrolase-like protein with peptidoglycan-binding domain